MATRSLPEVVLTMLALLALPCHGYEKDGVIYVPDQGYQVNNRSLWTLFKDKQTWNTARRVCHSLGGDLLSVSSPYVMELLRHFTSIDANWGRDMSDVWMSLYRQTNGVLVWSERSCRPLSGATFWKSANDDDTSQDKRCFRLKDYLWERRKCDEDNRFICDVKIGPCSMASQASPFRIQSLSSSSKSACEQECHLAEGCFMAAYSSADDSCTVFQVGGAHTTLMTKQCHNISTNNANQNFKQRADNRRKQPTVCSLPAPSMGPASPTSGQAVSPAPAVQPSMQTPTSSSSFPECPTSVSVMTVYHTVATSEIVTSTAVSTTTDVITSTAVVTTTVTDVISHTVEIPCAPTTVVVSASPVIATVTVTSSLSRDCPESTVFAPTTVTVSSLSIVTSCTVTMTASCDVSSMTSLEETTASTPALLTTPGIQGSSVEARESPGRSEEVPAVSLVCANVTVGNVSLKQLVASLVAELSVNAKNTSMALRKSISVPDRRASSTTIGFAAVVVTFVPLILCFVVDIPVLIRDLRNMAGHLRNLVEKKERKKAGSGE